MRVTASENNRISLPAQISDLITTVPRKTFSMQDNLLDGSYYPADVIHILSTTFDRNSVKYKQDGTLALADVPSYETGKFNNGVHIFEASPTNIVTNGNFANGTTGWGTLYSSLSAASNTLSITADGSQASGLATKAYSFVTGRKYYFTARVRVTNASCTAIRFRTNEAFIATQNNPTQNTWYTISGLRTATTDTTFWLQHAYADAATANGKIMEVQNVMAFDLTAKYGAGNEPTAEQMDAVVTLYNTQYWDGTIQADSLYYTLPSALPNEWFMSGVWKPDQASTIDRVKSLYLAYLYYDNSNRLRIYYVPSEDRLYFTKTYGGTTVYLYSVPIAYSAGQIIEWAFTQLTQAHGALVAGMHMWYRINGGSVVHVNNTNTNLSTAPTKAYIGCIDDTGYECNGVIDAVKLVDTTRISQDISEQYVDNILQSVVAPSYDAGTLALCTLNDTITAYELHSCAQLGWWGTTLSNGSAEFVSPITVEVQTEADDLEINCIKVVGDATLDEYPVDFDINLYDSTDTLISSVSITDNTDVVYRHIYGSTITGVNKIELSITKINKASRTVKLVELGADYVVVRSDTLAPLLEDTLHSLTNQLSSTDSILPKITDNLLSKLFASKDTLLPVIVDNLLSKQFASSDSIVVSVSESGVITVSLSSGDLLILSPTIEGVNITVNLFSAESLLVALEEDTDMTNVYTLMDAPERQIHAKIEITYTDTELDETIVASSSGAARYTYPAQVADNLTAAYKYFALHNNVLDGSFHPLDSTGVTQIGWWSDVLSNASAEFTSPPSVTIEFSARSITSLQVVGDDKANIFPVDFVITLFDGADVLLHTETVTANTLVTWTKDITAITGVEKLVLTISKINQINMPARVTELYTAVVQTYYDTDYVMLINLFEECQADSSSIPVGGVSSNELEVKLSNEDHRFDLDNPSSPLHDLLIPNRRVKAWLGIEIVPSTIEWYPLGVFWTTQWTVPRAGVEAGVTARDRLHIMSTKDFETSSIYTSYTVTQLFTLLFTDYGLTADQYNIDTLFDAITVPYAWFEKVSYREALNKLAEAFNAKVFCDRLGVIQVIQGPISSSAMMTFSESTNIFNIDRPQAWSKVVNYVEIAWYSYAVQASSTVAELTGLSESLDPSESLEIEVAYNKTPVSVVDSVTLTGGADLAVTASSEYAWGNILTITNNGATTQTLTGITIAGQVLEASGSVKSVAQDATSIKDIGKQSFRLDNYLIQSKSYADALAAALLAEYKQTMRDFSIESRGNIALRLADRVIVPTYASTAECIVLRQNLRYDGSLEATHDARITT